jgi:8-oxo-dGTP diphosphatase
MKHVAAAIIRQHDRVLIARRGVDQALAGYWEFPGGKLECGENPQQCVVRELREELGVETHAAEIIIEARYDYDGGAINLIAVQTTILTGDLVPTVHDALEWVRVDELLLKELAPADIPIAQHLIDRLAA